ncbi:MAG: response regulator transcription factor [Sedimentisphaerales bacterium]|jgi:two-component system phosphate regulon response regulator PhoB|nr:response regulator transcription factor [Sedimentisphaerales bacterium]
MPAKRILIVEDEPDILELLRITLAKEGYDPIFAKTGEQAIELAKKDLPDMVVLDIMLPGIDGLDVCKILRSDPRTSHIPIIMLTARSEEADIVTGLEVGADDYVTKPFSPKVLSARIRNLLRRQAATIPDQRPIRLGSLIIDTMRREVSIKGRPVILTYTEFNILLALARRPGVVLTRYQIMDAAHGQEYVATDRAVDVQIVALRRKLGTYGRCIQTVRGVGYRFSGPV